MMTKRCLVGCGIGNRETGWKYKFDTEGGGGESLDERMI